MEKEKNYFAFISYKREDEKWREPTFSGYVEGLIFPMTTLYLIRHGETKDNVAKIMQGQRQGELTSAGIAQIEKLAVSLSEIHFDAIVSSDQQRAYDSAIILAHKLNMKIQTTTLLRERDWGFSRGGSSQVSKAYPCQTILRKWRVVASCKNVFRMDKGELSRHDRSCRRPRHHQ